jgi:drug/metabolite transporter (DMT)-like permease
VSEELEPERRAPRSRAEERRFTWIGVGLAVVGAVVVVAPILATNDIGVVPAVVGVVFVACGCTMVTPGVFKPLVSQAIGLLPSLRK